jgi:hypothetical protein
MTESTVTVYSKNGRNGSRIPVSQYQKISHFILDHLKVTSPISINELLDEAFREFSHEDRNAFACTLLLVKGDLEARGLIKVTFNVGRSQYIQLKKRRKMLSDTM